MRSLLFVPGDNPRKMARALDSGADALILDLEDSVAERGKDYARRATAEFIHATGPRAGRPRLYVRVNALDTGMTDLDLDRVVPARPDGVLLPKARRGADVMLLDAKITTAEALAGIDDGATRIMAIATETGASLFEMGTYAGASARLAALTWGAEDLSADVGATANRDAGGAFTDLYRLARALTLAAAAAAEVVAMDTVYTGFRDTEGLRAECEEAVRDGFACKMAIHPAQVPVINEVFTPGQADVEEANAVVAAFGDGGTDGVTSLDDRMLDRPHLRRALRILARARDADPAD